MNRPNHFVCNSLSITRACPCVFWIHARMTPKVWNNLWCKIWCLKIMREEGITGLSWLHILGWTVLFFHSSILSLFYVIKNKITLYCTCIICAFCDMYTSFRVCIYSKACTYGWFKGFSKVVLTIHDVGMLAPHKMQLHCMCLFNMCGR